MNCKRKWDYSDQKSEEVDYNPFSFAVFAWALKMIKWRWQFYQCSRKFYFNNLQCLVYNTRHYSTTIVILSQSDFIIMYVAQEYPSISIVFIQGQDVLLALYFYTLTFIIPVCRPISTPSWKVPPLMLNIVGLSENTFIHEYFSHSKRIISVARIIREITIKYYRYFLSSVFQPNGLKIICDYKVWMIGLIHT